MLAQWGAPFSPSRLFRNGEQGVWYDPSDFSTMFQDSAGSTPVTSVEQPVGMILDKSRGLVAATKLDISGPFSNWEAMGTTPPTVNTSDNFSGSPCVSATFPTLASGGFGVSRADGALFGAGNGASFQLTSGYYYNCYYEFALSRPLTGSESLALYTTGSAGGNSFTLNSATPSGWTSGNTKLLAVSGSGPDYPVIYAQMTTSPVTVYLRRYRVLEIAGNHAWQSTTANRPTLQQDANGLYYLAFNGTNSSMVTGSIDFTSTAQMSEWAGVTKLSDAAESEVFEHGVAGVDPLAFTMAAPGGPSATYRTSIRGGGNEAIGLYYGYTSPNTAVFSSVLNYGGASPAAQVVSRINAVGVTGPTGATAVGSAFGSYKLYIGARGGSANFLTGRIYALIVRGAASSAQEIASTEQWVNQRMRAY